MTASSFLVALIAAVTYKIHTILTDNGIQFRFPPRYANGPTARYTTHMFAMRCRENGIEHRFAKINHPWTNGQVERVNRTIKEATVKRYHYDSHDQLERHLQEFVSAYNFGRRLKSLTPLRVHLQTLDFRVRAIHAQSNPSNAGTEHLAVWRMSTHRSGRGTRCSRPAFMRAFGTTHTA
ncbi:integrase-like protein [Chelatococcus asaccharovorans]|uniref:Integrase-like protein n=1 Tax=Chelatococcus asaccharovorans TaxID=28210 RepID=A0A2V3TVB0_9HYPH|nr:integrase-like protein [Chelatococcus asaccharovorans]